MGLNKARSLEVRSKHTPLEERKIFCRCCIFVDERYYQRQGDRKPFSRTGFGPACRMLFQWRRLIDIRSSTSVFFRCELLDDFRLYEMQHHSTPTQVDSCTAFLPVPHRINSSSKPTELSALMKCTDFIMNSKLFCLAICVVASQLIRPSLNFFMVWFCFCGFIFMINSESKEISNHSLLIAKVLSFIHQCQPTYKFTEPDGKGCLLASKLIKESAKHSYCKKSLFILCCLFYAVPAVYSVKTSSYSSQVAKKTIKFGRNFESLVSFLLFLFLKIQHTWKAVVKAYTNKINM
jgi:hypothetical protein